MVPKKLDVVKLVEMAGRETENIQACNQLPTGLEGHVRQSRTRKTKSEPFLSYRTPRNRCGDDAQQHPRYITNNVQDHHEVVNVMVVA